MNSTGRDVFGDALQESNHWPKLVMIEPGTDSRHATFDALRGTLRGLRDRIGPEIAACRQGEAVGARLANLPRCPDHGGMRKLSHILLHEILNPWPDELLRNA